MLVEILIVVGVFLLYCISAMCIHHHCVRRANIDPDHMLLYNGELSNEYSLIE